MLAKRDLGVILLALLGVYFSLQNEGVVSFQRAWHVPGDALGEDDFDADPISHRAKDAHAPRPVFFDLNGDGRNEVIVASSSEPEIRIASPPAGKREAPGVSSDRDSRLEGSGRSVRDDDDDEYAWRDGWIPARTVASASLMPSNVRVAAGRRAVALAAGHIDPPVAKDASVKKTNKGVVVVVTAAWHVLCFDHNLKLMWENSLQAEFPRHARVAEVAVLVSNATMFEGDRGSVVVGGRVELGDLDSDDEDPLEEELAHEDMMLGHRGGRRVAPDDLADANEVLHGRGRKGKGVGVDRSRHFNYYAFDGATGSTRWKHESEDFHRDLDGLADRLTPQHNYRLTAQASSGHHYGEVACRDFRESVVVNALPHAWREREDTALRLAHFRHHRTAKGARVSKVGSGRRPAVGAAGGAEGAEHTNPVARALAGAINAAWRGNGAPPAPDRRGGRGHSPDGQIGAKHRAPPNVIVAHQEGGVEVIHLYSGKTLCKMAMPPGGLHADINGDGVVDHVQAHGSEGVDAGGHPVTGADGKPAPDCWAQATSGVPVREHLFGGSVCRGSAGVVRHGSGHFKGEPGGGYVSNRAVQIVAPAQLRRGEEKIVRSLRRAVKDVVFLNSRGEVTCYGHDGTRRWQQRTDASWAPGDPGVVASLASFPLRVGGASEVVLAGGATHAALLTPSGYRLNAFKLPGKPVAALLVVDVDGDGLNDVVARTKDGDVYAWRQRSHPGLAPFTFLLGALAVAVAAAFVTQMSTTDEAGRIVRSTDVDEHESAKDSAGPSEKKGDDAAGEGDDVKVDAHPAEPEAKSEVTVMRPSMWIIPSLMYRALRARLDMWWVRVMVDPHFDEREFLTGAIGAHEVVLKNFAANDMRALGAMLTDRALAAFRDAFIEADRGNVTLNVDVERNENPIIVELSIRINDDVPDARAEEVMERVRASISSYGGAAGMGGSTRGGENDGSDSARFDAGEDDLLRLRVGVRFNSRELWTMTDKVSGRKSYSMDLRGHTFYFGRALPRFLPATAPLTSPWMLEDVK